MATRKKTAKKAEPEPEAEAIMEAPSLAEVEESPQIKRTVRQVSTWVETVPAIGDDSEEEEEAEGEGTPDFEDEEDPITAVLSDFGEGSDSAGFVIRVYRLPNYRTDGKTALRGTAREFCDDIPALPDYLKTIKENWGAGSYQLELRNSRMHIVKRRTVTVAAEFAPPLMQPARVRAVPNGQSSHAQERGPVYIEAPPPPPPPDFKAQLKETIATLKLLRELEPEAPAYEPTARPQENPPSPFSIENILMQNDKFVDTLSKGYLGKIFGKDGPAEDKDPWAEVAMETVKSGQAPQIIEALIGSLFKGLGGMIPSLSGGNNVSTQMVPTQVSQGEPSRVPNLQNGQIQGATAGSPPVETRPPTNGDTDTSRSPAPDVALYAEAITGILTQMRDNGDPAQAVKSAESFLFLHPEYTQTMESDFSQDPDTLLLLIGQIPGAADLASLPHARGWIERFQRKFFNEPEPEKEAPVIEHENNS